MLLAMTIKSKQKFYFISKLNQNTIKDYALSNVQTTIKWWNNVIIESMKIEYCDILGCIWTV